MAITKGGVVCNANLIRRWEVEIHSTNLVHTPGYWPPIGTNLN